MQVKTFDKTCVDWLHRNSRLPNARQRLGCQTVQRFMHEESVAFLDDWAFLPIAYLSITEEPEACKQLVHSFIGKFITTTVPSDLDWAEAKIQRYSR